MNNTEQFLQLVKENPALPIIPLVSYEVVCGDDYWWWLGEFGRSEKTQIYRGKENIHLKIDDEEEVLCDLANCVYGHDQQGRDIYDLSDDEWDALYASVPWEDAIVVYINVGV